MATNNVGSLYVDIRADMSSLTNSLNGLQSISLNIGNVMGLNMGSGINRGLSTAIGSITGLIAGINLRPIATMLTNLFSTISQFGIASTFNAIKLAANNALPGLIGSSATLASSLQGVANIIKFGMISGIVTLGVVGVAVFAKLAQATSDWIQEGIKYNAQMEQYKISFEVLTGSVKTATSLFKELRQYADLSTFTTPQVTEGTQLLLNYGVKAKDVMHVVKMLGDTSLGNAEKFKSQALAFGQIFSRGRVTGDNLRQLTEAGINPMQELSKVTGKTMGQLQTDMENGTISVDDLVKAFEAAVAVGGRFNNLQAKQSQSGLGMWSTIIDKFERFRGDTVIGLFEGLKPILGSIIGLLEKFNENIEPIQDAFTNYLLPVIKDVVAQIINLTGLTSGFNNITDATVGWIQALAGAIKVLMWITNLLIAFFGTFATGFLTIGLILQGAWVLIKNFWNLFTSMGTATILTVVEVSGLLYNNFKKVFTGIFDIGAWAFKGILNSFLEFKNSVADSFLGEKLGLSKSNLIWNPVPGQAIDDVNYIAGKIGEITSKNFSSAIDYSSEEFGKSFENLKGTADLLKQVALTTNGAYKNVFGSTSEADNLLENLGKSKNTKITDNQKGIETMNSVKDGAKKAADAVKKMIDEINSAKNAIFKFGDAFEKMTIEKFSPSKIANRIKKNLKLMEEWVMNLNNLQAMGVGQQTIQNLRDMGLKGSGIVKGLVRAGGTGQLDYIKSGLSRLDTLAYGEAIKTVIIKHQGEIKVTGTDRNGAYQIALDLAKDIRNGSYNYLSK